MSSASKNTRRRLDEIASRSVKPSFPRGLSGFGQRWEDRDFDRAEAEEELLELIADLPYLRESALAMVDMWFTAGRLDGEETLALKSRIDPGYRADAEPETPADSSDEVASTEAQRGGDSEALPVGEAFTDEEEEAALDESMPLDSTGADADEDALELIAPNAGSETAAADEEESPARETTSRVHDPSPAEDTAIPALSEPHGEDFLPPEGDGAIGDAVDAGEAAENKAAETPAEIGSTPDFEEGEIIAGRYQIVRRIGGGSMGVVYQAIDRDASPEGENRVALKVLSPKLADYGPAIRALQNEARTGMTLEHPSIVRTLALERAGTAFFIVMDWLPGFSLQQWFDAQPGEGMRIGEVLEIIEAIGSALAYAHDKGVVHADIKPGNVMLLEDGSVRLCDFGIARFRDLRGAADGRIDSSVLRAGTPAYSSPEVLDGDGATVRDDIFSLGCLAYRLLSGERPFGDRDTLEAKRAGVSPSPIDGIGSGRWRALSRALSAERASRQTNVEEFLEEFLTESSETSEVAAQTSPMLPEPEEHEAPIRFETEPRPPADTDEARPASSGWGAVAIVLGVILGVFLGVFISTSDSGAEFDRWIESSGVNDLLRSAGSYIEEIGQAEEDSVPEPEATESEGAAEKPSVAAGEVPADAREAPAPIVSPEKENVVESTSEPVGTPVAGAAVSSDSPRAADAIFRLSTKDRQTDTVAIAAMENEGTVLVDFVRAEGLDQGVEIEIVPISREDRLAGATDLAGEMIEPVLRLAPGESTRRLEVLVPDDASITGTRTYGFVVSQVSPERRDLGRLELSVRDDELTDRADYLPAGTVSFVDSQVVVEESAPAVRLRLVRYGDYESVRVTTVLISGIGASNGEDYSAPGESTIRFAPGVDNVSLFIPLIDDSIPEPDEVIRAILDDPAGPIGNPSAVNVRIRDDDY